MPNLDLDEVAENKKPFHMRIFLWEGHMLASWGKQSKTMLLRGMSGHFGAALGAPMAVGV